MKLADKELKLLENALRAYKRHDSDTVQRAQLANKVKQEIERRAKYNSEVIETRARVNALLKAIDTEYAAIRAWGGVLGNHTPYVDWQVQLAKRDNAPFNATYCKGDKPNAVWSTIDNISSLDTLLLLERNLNVKGAK